MKNSMPKYYSLSLLSLVVIFSIVVTIKIVIDINAMDSAFLPKYSVIYLHKSTINLSVFMLFGAIPALFLHIRKKPLLAIVCLLLFIAVGAMLMNTVKIYEHFYRFI